MNRSELINELAAALAKAQSQFTAVPKTKTATIKTKAGATFTYKYADLADCLQMAIPHLSANGIAFTQPHKIVDGALRVVTLLLHSSGQWMESDGIEVSEYISNDRGVSIRVDPQAFGGELTYYRRYDGCSFIGIAPDEDTDAQGEKPQTAKKPAKAEPAKPEPLEPKEPPPSPKTLRSKFFSKAKEQGWGLGDIKKYLISVFQEGSTANLTEKQLADTLEAFSQVKPEEYFAAVDEDTQPATDGSSV